VDRGHNAYQSPRLPYKGGLALYERKLTGPLYEMDEVRRESVLAAIREVCRVRGWNLLAAHVRMTHVHAVVDADVEPEKVMNDFKAYASRRLNRLEPRVRRWARHGSTRYLWDREQVSAAIRYVIGGQGEVMAVFEARPAP
jgi:REP element-mobilizing transposase RayT